MIELVIGLAVAIAGLLITKRRRRIRALERHAGMRPGTIVDARRAADRHNNNGRGGRK